MIEKENKDTNVIDLNIKGIGKKRIRINGDDSKILLLDTSDSGILKRFTQGYSELLEWKEKYTEKYTEKILTEKYAKDILEIPEETYKEDIAYWKQVAEKLSPIDKKMREILNYIFGTDVSSVCDGAMYDIVEDGKMRFESILEALMSLYEDTITNNYKKMSARANELAKDYIIKSD